MDFARGYAVGVLVACLLGFFLGWFGPLDTDLGALDQCRAELGRKWEESYRLEERDCSADGACKYTVLVPIATE